MARHRQPVPARRSPRAEAQAIIKVNDNVNFKVGILLQPQADWQEVRNSTDTGSGGFQQNLLLRRARLIFGGQVAKNVVFFFETENSNLGKSTQAVGGAQVAKSLGTGFNVLDAVAEWRIAKEFNIQIGPHPVADQPRGSEERPDAGSCSTGRPTTLPTSAALQNNSGRDTGAMLRGYFLSDHLEYRGAVFSGFRAPGVKNALRFAGRLQYNFFDTEVYNFVSYPGGYLGTKKILAVGGGVRHPERLPVRLGRPVRRHPDRGPARSSRRFSTSTSTAARRSRPACRSRTSSTSRSAST